MHGLELLKKGAIWRVGNGSSIKQDMEACLDPSRNHFKTVVTQKIMQAEMGQGVD